MLWHHRQHLPVEKKCPRLLGERRNPSAALHGSAWTRLVGMETSQKQCLETELSLQDPSYAWLQVRTQVRNISSSLKTAPKEHHRGKAASFGNTNYFHFEFMAEEKPFLGVGGGKRTADFRNRTWLAL